MRKVVGRFAATGSDGRIYTVEIVRSFTDAETPGRARDLGLSELFTANGQRVTRVQRGSYKVDGTNIVLSSSVPTAP